MPFGKQIKGRNVNEGVIRMALALAYLAFGSVHHGTKTPLGWPALIQC